MQDLSTASWVETQTRWGPPGGKHTLKYQHWLRTSPPAEANFIDFGDSWSQTVENEKGRCHTSSDWKMCSFHPRDESFDFDYLLSRVLFPPLDPDASYRRSHILWHQEQDGDKLVKWSREYLEGAYQISEIVWTEIGERKIVRKELRQADRQTGKPIALEVCDQYYYDTGSPEGVFEMPARKPIETSKESEDSKEVWEKLSDRERTGIQMAIDLSNAAWRNANFRNFALQWEFESVYSFPRRAEWRKRVREQKGIWSGLTATIESVSEQRFIPVQVARDTTFFNPVNRKILWVNVRLEVTSSAGERSSSSAEYFLRRKCGGFRIVHWECP